MGSAAECPILKVGAMFNNRFKVMKVLGKGNFGHVYEVNDVTTREACALKIEAAGTDDSVLKVEAGVMKSFTLEHRHLPSLIAAGKLGNVNYVAMTLLGPNMVILMRRMARNRFSLATTLRVGLQCLQALKDLHDCGFVHRDIKPANVVTGLGRHRQTIYIIDFGLARMYKRDGKVLVKKRIDVAFRGTPAFASINMHNRLEQGPHDDVFSLLYSLVLMHTGTLPWSTESNDDKIRRKKERITKEELFKGFPGQIMEIYAHLKKCTYESTVDYEYVENKCVQMVSRVNVRKPFDWEMDHTHMGR